MDRMFEFSAGCGPRSPSKREIITVRRGIIPALSVGSKGAPGVAAYGQQLVVGCHVELGDCTAFSESGIADACDAIVSPAEATRG